MKVCNKCHYEFHGSDGNNTCGDCERREPEPCVLKPCGSKPCEPERRTKRNKAAKLRRSEVKAAYESCGLTMVRGALGGVYYE